MIENIIFTGNVVAPVFLLVALGYFLKKINVINENFVDVTSKFVFNVAKRECRMPAGKDHASI